MIMVNQLHFVDFEEELYKKSHSVPVEVTCGRQANETGSNRGNGVGGDVNRGII